VDAFVAAAYAEDPQFGLLAETMAGTGARPSQLHRLKVEDLRDHPERPTLWMSQPAKGGHRNRAAKMLKHYSVAITPELAATLGMPRLEVARKHGISEATIYNWKAKFGGMDVSEAKRLKVLEEENVKLKKLLAEQMLDAAALRELLSNKW
jgi:putative transposase